MGIFYLLRYSRGITASYLVYLYRIYNTPMMGLKARRLAVLWGGVYWRASGVLSHADTQVAGRPHLSGSEGPDCPARVGGSRADAAVGLPVRAVSEAIVQPQTVKTIPTEKIAKNSTRGPVNRARTKGSSSVSCRKTWAYGGVSLVLTKPSSPTGRVSGDNTTRAVTANARNSTSARVRWESGLAPTTRT